MREYKMKTLQLITQLTEHFCSCTSYYVCVIGGGAKVEIHFLYAYNEEEVIYKIERDFYIKNFENLVAVTIEKFILPKTDKNLEAEFKSVRDERFLKAGRRTSGKIL